MKCINKITALFTVFFCLMSCETEPDLAILKPNSQLVVEGWIEQGGGPRVLLSLSAPFFTPIDSNNLRDYAVTQAKVTVVGANSSEVLTLKPNDVYFPPYYYFGISLRGELESSYELIVEYRGLTFTASTSIPKLLRPDSVWFNRNSETDTLGVIKFRLSDDGSENNYYRTLTRTLGDDNRFIPTSISVFNDEGFNGKTLEVSLSKGVGSVLETGADNYYVVGDTIILKFCSLDKNHYDFWNTYQNEIISSGNPFSVSNSGLKSNIEDGLGVWGGYAVSYDTIIAE